MSYSSKIRIGTTKEGLKFLEKCVNEEMINGIKDHLMSSYKVFKEYEDVVYIGWDWVKFHDGMSDAKAIRETLNLMEDKGMPYRMVVIGEGYVEYGDISFEEADPDMYIPSIYTNIQFTYDID